MGLLAHDFANQTIDRRNAAFLFAAAEHLGPMYIPRGQIGPSTFTEVFVFDSGGTTGCGSQCRLLAAARLNTAFFVRRDDELTRIQSVPLPNAIIQVEDTPGLGGEIRVLGKDPTAMSPRAKRIGAEPAPQGRPLISATNPCVITSRRISERESRDRGSCRALWSQRQGGRKSDTLSTPLTQYRKREARGSPQWNLLPHEEQPRRSCRKHRRGLAYQPKTCWATNTKP